MKSKNIINGQECPAKNLLPLVHKHQNTLWEKPIGLPTQKSWERFKQKRNLQNQEIILDSGIGVGLSSILLAAQNPHKIVLAHDRSHERLQSHAVHRLRWEKQNHTLENLFVIRADSEDLWRILAKEKLNISKHFVLYPNPYPKKSQLKKRWHGHPVFPTMCLLGDYLELRSNWKVYLEEFSIAYAELHPQAQLALELISEPLGVETHFERKYSESSHPLWRLKILKLLKKR